MYLRIEEFTDLIFQFFEGEFIRLESLDYKDVGTYKFRGVYSQLVNRAKYQIKFQWRENEYNYVLI